MAQPYIGEIRMFAGNFAPAGWHFCDGSLLAISNYDILFALIGTTYGGDGVNTFGVPDLRGRVPIHMGSSLGIDYVLAQTGGAETVTLTTAQMPAHSHQAMAVGTEGNLPGPAGNMWAASALNAYSATAPDTGHAMSPAALGSIGGSQPHENMMPFLAVSFIISLFGIFPTPN